MKPRLLSPLLVVGFLVVAAGLTGCSSDDPAQPTATETVTVTAEPEATDSPSPEPSDTSSETAGLPLTADTAIDAALEQVPDGTVVAGGRTDEAGQQVWYVEVRAGDGKGTELYLATASGEVVRERPTSLSSVASGPPPKLTAQEGLAVAVEAVPGSDVNEFDLEIEKGATAWYVLVSDDTGLMEVYVNADTGAVISQERDS